MNCFNHRRGLNEWKCALHPFQCIVIGYNGTSTSKGMIVLSNNYTSGMISQWSEVSWWRFFKPPQQLTDYINFKKGYDPFMAYVHVHQFGVIKHECVLQFLCQTSTILWYLSVDKREIIYYTWCIIHMYIIPDICGTVLIHLTEWHLNQICSMGRNYNIISLT